MLQEQAHARVALLLGAVEVPLQARHVVEPAVEVARLGLELLHADTIGADVLGPFDEALAGCGSDAVKVERDQPKTQVNVPSMTMQNDADPELAQEFVSFAVQAGVLRFGEFKTKAGRLSPYFFNAGLFDDGAKLGRLAEFYARRLLAPEAGVAFDMIFGPAYKGITLAAATCPMPTTARKRRTTAKVARWSAPRWPGAFLSSMTSFLQAPRCANP